MNLNSLIGLDGKKLILASASPRRASLMKLVGFDFEVQHSPFREGGETYTIPEVHVLEVSQKKAEAVAENKDDGLVIGADTIVVLRDDILGKPADAADACDMLRRLSGKSHTVFTGFALVDRPSGRMVSEYEKTEVTFRQLSDTEIEQYVETGSPLDKAGAYGIQDESALFVTAIHGCYYNVMGFPISRFYVTLRSFLARG